MPLRDTYAYVEDFKHRLKAVSVMLGISENTLRSTIADSKIHIRRASDDNPDSPAIRIFDLPTIFNLAAWRRDQKSRPTGPRRPIVIAVSMIKGGTGKTQTAAEIGCLLQLMGYKVALIDVDSQANLTQSYGYEDDLELADAPAYELSPAAIVTTTFYHVVKPIFETRPNWGANWGDLRSDVFKRPFGPNGPAILCADTFLGDLEGGLAAYQGPRTDPKAPFRETIFRDLFEKSVRGETGAFDLREFDVVILDCAPSISFTTTNAVVAADIVLAPLSMELFGVKGLKRLATELTATRERFKVNPRLMILPTFYSKTVPRVARMQHELMNSSYRDSIIFGSISTSEEFRKGSEARIPLCLQRPNIEPIHEYRVAAKAVAAAIEQIRTDRAKRAA